jgi:hypothetical protein
MMADETTNNNAPDGAENTEPGTQTNSPMIPKSRFDEVNRKMREYEKQLESLTRAQQERDEKEALSRGEHEKIINELKPQAEAAKKMTAALEQLFTLELQGVPEDMRDLIPDGDVSTRLTWLKNAKTRGLFAKPTPPITDAGAQGQPVNVVKLTDEEKAAARMAGMTEAQYAEYKSK